MLFSSHTTTTSFNSLNHLIFTMETGNIYYEVGNEFLHITSMLREIPEHTRKSTYKTPARFQI